MGKTIVKCHSDPPVGGERSLFYSSGCRRIFPGRGAGRFLAHYIRVGMTGGAIGNAVAEFFLVRKNLASASLGATLALYYIGDLE